MKSFTILSLCQRPVYKIFVQNINNEYNAREIIFISVYIILLKMKMGLFRTMFKIYFNPNFRETILRCDDRISRV